jgi:hypothetical protein
LARGGLPPFGGVLFELVVAGAGGGLSGRRGRRGDEFLGGLSAAFALFGWEPEVGAALVLSLPGGVGVVDAEVAGDQDGRGEERDAG